MSGVQQSLSGFFEVSPYRSIVKDAYTTRDEDEVGGGDTRLEIAAWVVMENEGDLVIKDENGNLMYDKILQLALGRMEAPGADPIGADTVSERTEKSSYRDDRGGRAASTVRGYLRNPERLAPATEGGLPASHPVKRVLRRWARSQDLGHFEDDESRERVPDEDAEPIDMDKLFSAYRLARSIASQNGFVFAPQEGDPVAVEDNERIDYDEVRNEDKPMGDTKAACLLEKPNGETYEYWIDLDMGELVRADGNSIPPGGW